MKVEGSFEIGDYVNWPVIEGKRLTIKKGRIVAIVPPEKDFREVEKELMSKYVFLPYWTGGIWRKKESYAVMVEEKEMLPKLYWPKAEQLAKMEEKYAENI